MALASAALAWLASWATGYSLPLVSAPSLDGTRVTVMEDGTVLPLADFDFNEGEWAAYILLDPEDFRQVHDGIRRNCLKLTDRAILTEMAKHFRFQSRGDVATITSHFIVVKNDTIVFSSGISLYPAGGLQSSAFGWAEEEQTGMLLSYTERFQPIASPIVLVP